MYLKLLFMYIFLFILIFINISNAKRCKCPKIRKSLIHPRRSKRGALCSCARGSRSSDKDEGVNEKRVLYIVDNFTYSPFQFHLQLAKILSQDYKVEMLVYCREGEESEELENLKIIKVPINRDYLKQRTIEGLGIEAAFIEFRASLDFDLVGIYKEIFTNTIINIGGELKGIYTWLHEKQKDKHLKYSFGIAEFIQMPGAFAVFEALGIEKTFDACSSIFRPDYLQFLDDIDGNPIDVTKLKVPEFKSSEPGDWKSGQIWIEGTERYNENKQNHDLANERIRNKLNVESAEYYDNLFNEPALYAKDKPSSMEDLFKKIKYHFVNQHKFGIFETFPEHNKIIYIGGFHVEENENLNIRVRETKDDEPECIVLVSFGTVKVSGSFDKSKVKIMFNLFNGHRKCIFKVRIDVNLLPEKYNTKIIHIYDRFEQPKELFKANTKLFISHCGMHSLNEAIYAGVPLICIPHGVDQFYNASVAEHLNIGIYVSYIFGGFQAPLKTALDDILKTQ